MTEIRFADEYLATWDIRTAHQIDVAADGPTTFAAMKEVDLATDNVIRRLFRMRGLPGIRLNLDELSRVGFIPLEEVDASHVIYGIVGRFWLPSGRLQKLSAETFRDFEQPGFAKAVWTLAVGETEEGARLSTETRVHCTDTASRRKFRAYWSVVGSMSSLVRRRALRLIKARAEAGLSI